MTDADFENFLVYLRRFFIMKKVPEIREFRRCMQKILNMSDKQLILTINEMSFIENTLLAIETAHEFRKIIKDNFKESPPECLGL